jgi:type VI secretion system protein ImpA
MTSDFSSQSVPASRLPLPEQETFLKEISPQNPVGVSLRYDPLYDEVRSSRLEDDARLSMGIWKTDLKRADWGKVESLCVLALLNRTKDVQIAAWLAEAWVVLDGMDGFSRGINLVRDLCLAFWASVHPQGDDAPEMENRSLIFEWMDSTFSSRLMEITLTQSPLDHRPLGLGFLKSAQHADVSQKRGDKSAKPPAKQDTAKTMGTLDEIYKGLEQTPLLFLSDLQTKLIKALEATQSLKDVLISLWGTDNAPSFLPLLKTLKEMDRIIAMAVLDKTSQPVTLEGEKDRVDPMTAQPAPVILPAESLVASSVPLPVASAVVASSGSSGQAVQVYLPKTRRDAYHHLELIADYLEANDPHSPAHQLLRQLIRWENQNILDIFGEIAQSPQDLGILMKLLGSSPVKKA